jgi:peptidoglycan/LPS O-acetylase OafA/YrhL
MSSLAIPCPPSSHRFATLDGLRGLAALMVVIYHYQQRFHLPEMPGYLAVDLFFAISGFVLAEAYGTKLANGMRMAQLARDRILRLYPLYALGLLVGVTAYPILEAVHDPAGSWNLTLIVAVGLAMMPMPIGHDLFPLNGPAWSLFFEMVVNLVFAGLLWRVRSRQLATMMAIAALILAMRVSPDDYLNLGWSSATFSFGAIRAFYGFSAGILIWRVAREETRPPGLSALMPLAIVAAILTWRAPAYRAAWEIACVLVVLPLIVGFAARVEPPQALRRLFAVAGDLSYPLYAIHWPALALALPLTAWFSPRLLAFGVIPMLVLLAWLAGRYLDAPVRRALRQLLPAVPVHRNSAAALTFASVAVQDEAA